MKNSIGTTFVFTLVLVFTLIFAGFLVLVLSYSKAYKIKNEMTTIIEKYEGLTKSSKSSWGSIKIINNYLSNSSYITTGKCEYDEYSSSKVYGMPASVSLNTASDSDLVLINSSEKANEKYYYCVSYEKIQDSITNNSKNCSFIFNVTVFYNFNLPVFGMLKLYKINGQTNEIYRAYVLNELSC